MRRISLLLFLSALLLGATPVQATAEDGILNPEELTLDSVLNRAREGKLDWLTCAQGYWLTKKGRHEDARDLFQACAQTGNTQSMTWMSYMDQNGFGDPDGPDFEAAAEWSREAAERGDEVGQFNYGLHLLMGLGVKKDPEKAKEFIDRAAEQGLKGAIMLQDAGYRVQDAIPDADEHLIPKEGTGF